MDDVVGRRVRLGNQRNIAEPDVLGSAAEDVSPGHSPGGRVGQDNPIDGTSGLALGLVRDPADDFGDKALDRVRSTTQCDPLIADVHLGLRNKQTPPCRTDQPGQRRTRQADGRSW